MKLLPAFLAIVFLNMAAVTVTSAENATKNEASSAGTNMNLLL